MEQTDMLIVAGGDGTLQEVITGLLRRPDQVECHRVITSKFMAERREDNFTLTFCWWMFCCNRIKWVTYQLDSFLWALVILWVQAFTSSVTTRSSKNLSCFKLHDLLSLLKEKKKIKWLCLTANILELYQGHHISNTGYSERSNCTAGRSANQSEMLFLIISHFVFSEMVNKPEERITGLLSSCMTLISLALHACVSRGRKNNQCLLWSDCVGGHLEMQLQQSGGKIVWKEFWFNLGNLQT